MKKFLKILGGIILFFIIVIVIVINTPVARNYAQASMGAALLDLVKEVSPVKVATSYSKVRFSIVKSEMYVEDFSLDFTMNVSDSATMVKSIDIDQLDISIDDIWKAIMEKDLEVEGISVHKPTILMENRKRKKTSFSLETANLYQYISKSLKQLAVSEFELNNGHLIIDYTKDSVKNSLEIADVSIGINGLLLNETSEAEENRIFGTEEIWLQFKNQSIVFADSLNVLEFDSLYLSTASNTFEIFGFHMIPFQDSITTNSYVEASVPYVQLFNIDYNKVYNDQTIEIDTVLFRDAFLKVGVLEKKKGGSKSALLNQIHRYFSPISIHKVKVENMKLEFNQLEKQSEQMEIDQVDLTLNEIFLDENMVDLKWNDHWFEDFNFKIKDYTLELGESNHMLKIGALAVSSSDKTLEIDSASVFPIEKSRWKSALNELEVEKFVLEGFDPYEIYENQLLNLQVAELKNLKLKHQPKLGKSKRKKQEIPDLENIYPYVKDVFKSIRIDSLKFSGLDVNIKLNTGEVDVLKGRLAATKFVLDSTTYLRDVNFLNTASLAINLPKVDLTLKDHKVGIQNFYFDKRRKVLSTKKIQVDSLSFVGGSKLVGSVEEVFLRGANIRQLLYNKQYVFDSLVVKRPNFYYVKADSARKDAASSLNISAIVNRFKIGLFRLEHANWFNYVNGKENIEIGDLSFFVKALELDEKKLLKNEIVTKYSDLKLNFDHLLFDIPKIKHQLLLGQSYLDVRARFGQINAIELKPYKGPLAMAIECSVPELNISGLNTYQSYFNRKLDADKISLISPSIKVQFNSKLKGQNASLKNSKGIMTVLDSLGIGQLVVSKGKVGLNFDDKSSVAIPRLDLTIKDFELLKKRIKARHKFLYADDMHLTAYNSRFSSPKLTASMEKVKFSTKAKKLDVTTFFLKSDSVELNVQDIDCSGLDIVEVLEDKKLNLKNLIINRPALKLKQGKKQNTNKEFAQLKKFPLDKNFVHTLSCRDLNINNALFEIDNSGKMFKMAGVNGAFKQFSMVNNGFGKKGRPFHSRSYDIKINNYAFREDRFYGLSIRNARYRSLGGKLELNGLKVDPKFKKREFGKQFGKQTDRIVLSNETVKAYGFDLERFVETDYLRAKKIVVEHAKIDVFRDKNIAFPEDQRRALPQTTFRNVSTTFDVDTLQLKGFDIVYEELQENKPKPGVITFDNLNANAYNLTNDAKVIRKNSNTTITASTRLYNSGTLTANFHLNLLDPEDQFTFNAQLVEMDLTQLNRMLEPSSEVKISSGWGTNMVFSGEANDEFAHGVMSFEYHKLKVFIKNEQKKNTKKRAGKAITTFFANTFVVRSNNKEPLLRDGEMFFIRDHTRSIFNYLAKTTLSGIVESIGAQNNRKEIRQHNKVAKQQAKNKK